VLVPSQTFAIVNRHLKPPEHRHAAKLSDAACAAALAFWWRLHWNGLDLLATIAVFDFRTSSSRRKNTLGRTRHKLNEPSGLHWALVHFSPESTWYYLPEYGSCGPRGELLLIASESPDPSCHFSTDSNLSLPSPNSSGGYVVCFYRDRM
jgi:hypothetical protein